MNAVTKVGKPLSIILNFSDNLFEKYLPILNLRYKNIHVIKSRFRTKGDILTTYLYISCYDVNNCGLIVVF